MCRQQLCLMLLTWIGTEASTAMKCKTCCPLCFNCSKEKMPKQAQQRLSTPLSVVSGNNVVLISLPHCSTLTELAALHVDRSGSEWRRRHRFPRVRESSPDPSLDCGCFHLDRESCVPTCFVSLGRCREWSNGESLSNGDSPTQCSIFGPRFWCWRVLFGWSTDATTRGASPLDGESLSTTTLLHPHHTLG